LFVPSNTDATLSSIRISYATFKFSIYLYQIKIIEGLNSSYESTLIILLLTSIYY